MKIRGSDVAIMTVVALVTWYGGADIASNERSGLQLNQAAFQLELDATVTPAKAVPSHEPKEPTPIPQPIDEELAKRVARR